MINQQMPGQSAGIASVLPPVMQGMKPQMGGPSAGVNNWQSTLEQLPIPQLLAEFMNPASKVPKFAVLSAIDQTKKKEAATAAAQGAQAQNAAAQQAGTVTDAVIAPLVQMARHGGAMHSYNRGGIVGYADGTPPEGATSYPVKEEWWEKELRRMQGEDVEDQSSNIFRDILEADKRQSAKIVNAIKKAFTYSSDVEKEKERAAQEEASSMGVGLPSMTPEAARVDVTQGPLPTAPGASPTPSETPERLLDTRRIPEPQVKPPPAVERPPAAQVQRPPAGLPGILDMDPYFKAERERLEGAGRPSADVIRAREAYDALMKQQADARAAAAERRAKGIEALQERAARAGDIDRSDLLLALGTSLSGSKTFSEGMGAAGQALQGLRKAAGERVEKAQERLERRQDLADQLAATDAELARVAQAELVARATGDDRAVREAAAAKNALMKQRFEIGVQLEELALRGRQVGADEEQARAARELAEDEARHKRELASIKVTGGDQRAKTMQRYYESWEKIDPIQKADLAKQGIKTFNDYTRLRDAISTTPFGGDQPRPSAPAVGTVMQGYRFKGGDPSDRKNWEKV